MNIVEAMRQYRLNDNAITNATVVSRWATTVNIDNGVWGTITDTSIAGSNVVRFPAADRVTVVSTTANDAAAGTGIQTLRLHAIDANYAEVTYDVSMNGTTQVATAVGETALAVNDVQALTVGSGGVADGNIRLWDFTTANYGAGAILSGANSASHAHYCVPAGKKLIITMWGATPSLLSPSGGVIFESELRYLNGTDTILKTLDSMQIGEGAPGVIYKPCMFEVPEQSFVAVYGQSNADNTVAHGGFTGFLVSS